MIKIRPRFMRPPPEIKAENKLGFKQSIIVLLPYARIAVIAMSLIQTRWKTLRWMWRRLGRMSPAELPHRAMEQIKRLIDRVDRKPWSAFGQFEGGVFALNVFRSCALSPAVQEASAEEAASVRAGRFAFFGQPWPMVSADGGEAWWDTDFWLVDPMSEARWPGSERSAFEIDYRGNAARGDVKFVWELNRLQFLPSLALHAEQTGDAADSALVFDILRGWMRANPPGRGVNWTSGIEAATRVASLLSALAFVAPKTPADKDTVKAFLHAHVHWIARYPSRFSSANNHRVAEAAALFLANLCAPGSPGSGRGARRAKADLEREILRQFHNDGVGAEQSSFYAAYSLEWFLLAGIAGDDGGQPFSSAFRERARLALHHLCWIIDEAGAAPRIGDSDDGCVIPFFRKADQTYIKMVADRAAVWLNESPPTTGIKTFPSGGQTVWRSPRADGMLLLAFDHGPLGHLAIAAHGHADALSIWLHWGDEAVFIDPGTYLYHVGEPLRDVLRGTKAHNTLAVGGQDQSRIEGPFAWSRHARTCLLKATELEVEAEHDGYRRRFGLTHRRRVCFEGDVILIEDRLLGRSKVANPPWSLGFTLNPGTLVELNGPCARVRTPGGRSLSLTADLIDGPRPAWILTETPFAPAFGSLQSAPRLELSGYLEAASLVASIRIVLGATDHQDRPL